MFKLESYGPDEGPVYPRCSKKGDVAGFFRKLQTKELYACTKGIFAPVRVRYDASAENLARFNREYSLARFNRQSTAEASREVNRLIDLAHEKASRFERVRKDRTMRVLACALAA